MDDKLKNPTPGQPQATALPAVAACPQCFHSFDTNDRIALDLPAVIVLADILFSFNGMTINHRLGAIESDQGLVRFMLGDPGIQVACARDDEFATCPKCRHSFALPRVMGDPILTAQWRERMIIEAQARRDAEEKRRAEQETANAVLREKQNAEAKAKMITAATGAGLGRLGD